MELHQIAEDLPVLFLNVDTDCGEGTCIECLVV